ncbi:MAG TPA: aroma-sacti cluster domain-containing protein [Jatrophihabitans sp.]|nr:aroma-sacti cluster domain-containing protein [Jatrophihabitans sp.]
MTEPDDALRAALEAAGLSLQAIPEDQRAMFTSLTDEEVTRLIKLRAGKAEKIGGTGGTAPEPVPPDPAISDPAIPDPAIPDPAIPDPAISDPDAIASEPEGLDTHGGADRSR